MSKKHRHHQSQRRPTRDIVKYQREDAAKADKNDVPEIKVLKYEHQIELLKMKCANLEDQLKEKDKWHADSKKWIEELIRDKERKDKQILTLAEAPRPIPAAMPAPPPPPQQQSIDESLLVRRRSDLVTRSKRKREGAREEHTQDLPPQEAPPPQEPPPQTEEPAPQAEPVKQEAPPAEQAGEAVKADPTPKSPDTEQVETPTEEPTPSPTTAEAKIEKADIEAPKKDKPKKKRKPPAEPTAAESIPERTDEALAAPPKPVKPPPLYKRALAKITYKQVQYLLASVVLALLMVIPTPLQHWFLETEMFHFQEKIKAPTPHPKVRLMLVTQDDLNTLESSWPLDRAIFRVFHEYLSDVCGAKTIAYDILYTEPQEKGEDEEGNVVDADADFGEQVHSTPNTIMAGVAENEKIIELQPDTDPFKLKKLGKDPVEGVLLPIKPLYRPNHVGLVNTNTADRVRKVPLFFNVNETYLPGLFFQAVLNYGDVESRMFKYTYNNDLTIKAWAGGEDRKIPLYNKNEIVMTLYGDIDVFKPMSLVDLFPKIENDEAVEEYKDALVFIGVHDGVMDVHKNARGEAVSGVLFHATLASNIMQGHFISPLNSFLLSMGFLGVMIASILGGWICNRFYFLKRILVQRWIFAFTLPVIGLAVGITFLPEGGMYRYIMTLSMQAFILFPLATFKFARPDAPLPTFTALDLSKRLTINHTVLNQVPRPMALSYERHLQLSSDKSQHQSTVFEERVIRFLALSHLAILHRSGARVDSKFANLLRNDIQLFRRPIAAGTCIGLTVFVRKMLKEAEDERFFSVSDPKSFRDTFLKERQAGGHYDLGNKKKGKVSFDEWLIEYWRTYRFRLFVFLGQGEHDGKKVFLYEDLNGVHRLGQQMIESNQQLEVDHVYLINRDGFAVDLHPFIMYRPYEQTQPKELLELNQLTEAGAIYKSLSGAETVEIDDPGVSSIMAEWDKGSQIKRKKIPQLEQLQQIFDDDLKPWSVGDYVLDGLVIEKELFRQHQSYWYVAKSDRKAGKGGRSTKEVHYLLNYYLKGTAGYKNIDRIKERFGKELPEELVFSRILDSDTPRGFWIQYPAALFPLSSKVSKHMADEMQNLLKEFHKKIGPHGLLSRFSFVHWQHDGKTELRLLPGAELETFGQKGAGLQRMRVHMMDREKQDLQNILKELVID